MDKYKYYFTFLISILTFAAGLFSQIITNKTFGLSEDYANYILIITVINFFTFYVHPYKETLVLTYAAKNNNEEKSVLISNSLTSLIFISFFSSIIFILYIINFKKSHNFSFINVLILLIYLILYIFSETYSYLVINVKKVLLFNNLKILITIICLLNLYLFAKKLGPIILYINLMISQFFILSITFYFLLIEKIKYKFSLNGIFSDIDFKRHLFSFLFTYFFAQIFPICEKYFIKEYSSELLVSYYISTNVLNTLISIITMILSQYIYEKFLNKETFNDKKLLLFRTLFILFHIFMLLNIYLYFNSYSIIEFLFLGNKFDINAVTKTANILKLLSFVLIPISLSSIIGRYLFSELKTKFFINVSFVNLISGILFLIIGKYLNNFYFLIMSWLFANISAFIATVYFLFKEIPISSIIIKFSFIIKNLFIILFSICFLQFLNKLNFNYVLNKILFTGVSFTISYIILFLIFFKKLKYIK